MAVNYGFSHLAAVTANQLAESGLVDFAPPAGLTPEGNYAEFLVLALPVDGGVLITHEPDWLDVGLTHFSQRYGIRAVGAVLADTGGVHQLAVFDPGQEPVVTESDFPGVVAEFAHLTGLDPFPTLSSGPWQEVTRWPYQASSLPGS